MFTISEFARLVGLAPSALRFYDDCGVLPPASVDETNGYRYYTPSQEARARLLRDLREIDLPLAEVRTALDADPAELAAVVRAHLRTVEAKTAAARAAADHLLTQLQADRTVAVLGGPELASALRQVTPAAATTSGSESEEWAGVLECVLVELGSDEVTFVATDRYRLAMRTVQPVEFSGAPARLMVPASELSGLSRWVAAGELVRIETGPDGAAIVRDGDARDLTVVSGEYPAYDVILDGLTPPECRVVVDRTALRAALEGREVVAFDIDSAELRIDDETRLEVIGSGSTRIGFTASLLAAALEASVGPDVLLEICAQDRPVVVRSADQGTFTTLVMPVRLDG
ncbi:MerR family transcriptional regulator [Kribbella sp. NPDC023972]|uniref:DNA polymerase III subunit beta family protein n=1 Tax=Kribbella sp. NPDC023972 TaxID=3154795 RepID=UPI0033C824DD